MSAPNPYIANGTCYFAAGRKSDAKFAPCGNDLVGHAACCQLGDQCLGNNACYSGAFGTTYLAGCSDPDYDDPSCPNKGKLADEPWTGLVYCNGTSREWFACEQDKSPPTIAKPDSCWCPEKPREVAFSDGATLDYMASMPQSTGQSIVWQAGFLPTMPPTTVTATATSSGGGGGGGGGTTGSPSSSPSPTDSDPIGDENPPASAPSGLSPSATAGVAVGVSLGSLILIGTLVFLFLAHRRRTRAAPAPPSDASVEQSPILSELPGQSHFLASKGPHSRGQSPSDGRFSSSPSAGLLSPYSAAGGGSSGAPSELHAEGGLARPSSWRSELSGSDARPGMAENAAAKAEEGRRGQSASPAELPA